MQRLRAAVPLIASLVVIFLACTVLEALVPSPLSIPGKVVACLGLAGALYSAVQLFRSRKDPYDLSTLWDTPPPAPEAPTYEAEDEDWILCHRCGHALPPHIGVCPECGSRLGH